MNLQWDLKYVNFCWLILLHAATFTKLHIKKVLETIDYSAGLCDAQHIFGAGNQETLPYLAFSPQFHNVCQLLAHTHPMNELARTTLSKLDLLQGIGKQTKHDFSQEVRIGKQFCWNCPERTFAQLTIQNISIMS